jgi:hypothetical protein
MESSRYECYLNWIELQKNNEIDTKEFTFMSRLQFNTLIQTHINNLKSNFQEKTFLNRITINDIKKTLLEPRNTEIKDSKFRTWARTNFKLLSIGSYDFVCEIPTNKKKISIENKNREIVDLPILAREDMYYEFCTAHNDIIHGGQKPTYKKLNEKWSGVNQKLVSTFVNNCSICISKRSTRISELAGKPIISSKFMSRVQVRHLI